MIKYFYIANVPKITLIKINKKKGDEFKLINTI